ncbi:hypothetical protein AB0K52_24785 [Glycomyces sp. NPDC049804]|uniref:hypothetical protein n=1 Tax=Glycomyces sp. NPDC049804 TaxID=3154363 RepID=UPI003417DA58
MELECWYCGEAQADPARSRKVRLEYWLPRLSLRDDGLYAADRIMTIEVPRCRECYDFVSARDRKMKTGAVLLMSGVLGILGAILFAVLGNAGWQIFVLLFGVPVSLIVIGARIHRAMPLGRRRRTFDYPPLQEAVKSGWAPNPGEQLM